MSNETNIKLVDKVTAILWEISPMDNKREIARRIIETVTEGCKEPPPPLS
jgi:hypothetical protein